MVPRSSLYRWSKASSLSSRLQFVQQAASSFDWTPTSFAKPTSVAKPKLWQLKETTPEEAVVTQRLWLRDTGGYRRLENVDRVVHQRPDENVSLYFKN